MSFYCIILPWELNVVSKEVSIDQAFLKSNVSEKA